MQATQDNFFRRRPSNHGRSLTKQGCAVAEFSTAAYGSECKRACAEKLSGSVPQRFSLPHQNQKGDYVDHPLLKNIRAEDIEDYTERYASYFGVEFESDTVKKISIRDKDSNKVEFFLISLIEHKSKVDYNVSVQLLKYIACIWAEYEKHFGTDYKDKVKTQSFRYPPILPVVYYEGQAKWSAPMCSTAS